MAKKKKKVGVVFSTNPDYEYQTENNEEETLPIENQKLRVLIDRKQRKGKEVTLVEGFVGTEADLKELGKKLKTHCGVGGSVKNQEILIQGNQVEKVFAFLQKLGYSTRK